MSNYHEKLAAGETPGRDSSIDQPLDAKITAINGHQEHTYFAWHEEKHNLSFWGTTHMASTGRNWMPAREQNAEGASKNFHDAESPAPPCLSIGNCLSALATLMHDHRGKHWHQDAMTYRNLNALHPSEPRRHTNRRRLTSFGQNCLTITIPDNRELSEIKKKFQGNSHMKILRKSGYSNPFLHPTIDILAGGACDLVRGVRCDRRQQVQPTGCLL
ncbi:hypothetical protein OS493_030807 [Desmophyllum pertusum]|uniref:Uncharacterized protein n=1 Tax=Desmophyllum pertusum TaxID=174260 RepID=A0A9W9YL65_9CNID|nr:hypothetical protein OS493_030807 [Desmophyllum pertusum]